MTLLATVHGRGTLAARPAAAAANEGYIYFATDGAGALYRSNAASWDTYAPSGGLADQGTATFLDWTTGAAPANPAAGKIRTYSKTGDTFAQRTSAGVETVFGAGGGGAFVGCRVRRAAAQTFAVSGTAYDVDFDTEDFDTDTMHFTSSAALTGTVAKTNGSATLTGTGTAFTSELSVGQVISVPGTAAEKRVVTAIASDTSLTVNGNFANTASGQTATRLRSPIVFRTAGKYAIRAHVGFANGTGARYAQLKVQSGATQTDIAIAAMGGPVNGGATTVPVIDTYSAAQWDFVELLAIQTSGGSLNSESTAGYQPTLSVSLDGA